MKYFIILILTLLFSSLAFGQVDKPIVCPDQDKDCVFHCNDGGTFSECMRIKKSGGVDIVGVTNGSSAVAGTIGEVKIATPSSTRLSTGTPVLGTYYSMATTVQLTLGAGSWYIYGHVTALSNGQTGSCGIRTILYNNTDASTVSTRANMFAESGAQGFSHSHSAYVNLTGTKVFLLRAAIFNYSSCLVGSATLYKFNDWAPETLAAIRIR